MIAVILSFISQIKQILNSHFNKHQGLVYNTHCNKDLQTELNYARSTMQPTDQHYDDLCV
jgi:hypothetical protein